jgi:hypothetical protein
MPKSKLSPQARATLGQDLKRERELRSVSLKEIVAATKINARFLEALEADRWGELPDPFLIKGVIRAFCKTIGADEDSFVNKYHHEVLLRTAVETRESKRPAVRRVEAEKRYVEEPPKAAPCGDVRDCDECINLADCCPEALEWSGYIRDGIMFCRSCGTALGHANQDDTESVGVKQ